MYKRKSAILFLFLFTALFVHVCAYAEEVSFTREYSYQAGEADSKLSARAIALEQVKRLLLEELGTYLISETEVKNFQLTKDKITTLSAGIVATQIIEDKWNGEVYYLKAKINADPNEVAQALNKLRNDKQKDKELEESKKRADDAFVEIARLQKELETSKGDKQKHIQYAAAANVLSAKDWYEKGYKLGIAGDSLRAVNSFNKAIELDPTFARAYDGRGTAYNKVGDNKSAIVDFDKAIELNPKDDHTYYNRGVVYHELGKKTQAIANYDIAIELNPTFVMVYLNRGIIYNELGDNKRAIADYDKAIELNPKFADAYHCRGVAYFALGNKKQAIADWKVAARFGVKLSQDWLRKQGIEW